MGLGKEMIMFETNTASCGGFAGISDSFGAALWALDYGLQMSYSNFSHALLHVGGRNDHYNAFTAPPTNESDYNQWTIGTVFYSAMIMGEITGKSGTTQITDLNGNDGNIFTPQYAVYDSESGSLQLKKIILFNYMTDANGAANIQVTIRPDGTIPAQVAVKYVLLSLRFYFWLMHMYAGISLLRPFLTRTTLNGQVNLSGPNTRWMVFSEEPWMPRSLLAILVTTRAQFLSPVLVSP
jgi:hypothetical protein